MGTPTTFTDADLKIVDNGDPTKVIQFEASPITTGTTRTITMANAPVDLADVNSAMQADGSVTATGDQDYGGNSLKNLRIPEYLQAMDFTFIPGAGLTTNSGVGATVISSTIGATNVLFGRGMIRHATTAHDSEYNFAYHPQFSGANTNTLYYFADTLNPTNAKFQVRLYDGTSLLYNSGDQNASASDTLETLSCAYTTTASVIYGRLIGYSQLTNAVYFQRWEP